MSPADDDKRDEPAAEEAKPKPRRTRAKMDAEP